MEKICKNCKHWDRHLGDSVHGLCNNTEVAKDLFKRLSPPETFGCIHFEKNCCGQGCCDEFNKNSLDT